MQKKQAAKKSRSKKLIKPQKPLSQMLDELSPETKIKLARAGAIFFRVIADILDEKANNIPWGEAKKELEKDKP